MFELGAIQYIIIYTYNLYKYKKNNNKPKLNFIFKMIFLQFK